MTSRLAISGAHHQALMDHLFPGDGLEAAAALLCSRLHPNERRFAVQELVPIPYSMCSRQRDRLSWPSRPLDGLIDKANADGTSIILTHSHPGGHPNFSQIDDLSDRRIVPQLYAELEHRDTRVGTAIFLPDGMGKARIYDPKMEMSPIDAIRIAGEQIQFSFDGDLSAAPMAFSGDMRRWLSRTCVCIVGISGTGSIVAEQLARLGVGKLIFIDPDHVEHKNLNRILNSTSEDAEHLRPKAEMFESAVRRYRNDVEIETAVTSIEEHEAVLMAGQADVLISCVDSAVGRQLCDMICSAFVIPLIDMGVVIPTETTSCTEITDVLGRIDYVVPGGPSLKDRESVYTDDMIRGERLRANDPDGYRQELEDGYVKGVADEAPSVISLNMMAASFAVNELIARVFPYRFSPNESYGRIEFSLAEMSQDYYSPSRWKGRSLEYLLGRGCRYPLLGIARLKPQLSHKEVL